jgi:hypothetical protein
MENIMEYRFFNPLGVTVHTSYDKPVAGACFTLDGSPESYEYQVVSVYPEIEGYDWIVVLVK